jgi:serine/threonine protein phosphatase PrpC
MQLEYFTHTERGPRPGNEDALQVAVNDFSGTFCVADGVGGSNCGSMASSISVTEFVTHATVNANLATLLKEIQNKLLEYQTMHPECKGMATTFTGCLVHEDKLLGIHAGDSKLFVLRRNGIKQLTETHTEAFRLYKAGKLSADEFLTYPRKNIIESALGTTTAPMIQEFTFDLESGDRILITTDGVHDFIAKKEFRDLSLQSSDVHEFGEKIILELANKPLTDNATFVLFSVE